MGKLKTFIKDTYIYIILIILVILLKIYVVAPIRVNGSSMIDTLQDRDIMILDKISYKFNNIERFDIVVVDDMQELIIKRIIGLPGETIEYKDNRLYIDGKYIEENFSHKRTDDFSLNKLDSKKIPDDCYFVLGDNRINSKDSRIIGFINKKQILGKTSFTIFPLERIGNKN